MACSVRFHLILIKSKLESWNVSSNFRLFHLDSQALSSISYVFLLKTELEGFMLTNIFAQVGEDGEMNQAFIDGQDLSMETSVLESVSAISELQEQFEAEKMDSSNTEVCGNYLGYQITDT